MKLGEAWPDSGVSYWNHNVHYHPVILNAVPPGCRDAIDVGCGDGMLACALAARCAAVTGIDRDALMITLARDRAHTVANATFLEGDFMAHPFGDESVDFACANTSVHHMGSADAIAKMARVVRPGGRLVVVGLAATDHRPTGPSAPSAFLPTGTTRPFVARAAREPRCYRPT
jgi:ubiquinone/menaquinone biosynthesis C-methylase UbiE